MSVLYAGDKGWKTQRIYRRRRGNFESRICNYGKIGVVKNANI